MEKAWIEASCPKGPGTERAELLETASRWGYRAFSREQPFERVTSLLGRACYCRRYLA